MLHFLVVKIFFEGDDASLRNINRVLISLFWGFFSKFLLCAKQVCSFIIWFYPGNYSRAGFRCAFVYSHYNFSSCMFER